jgi:ribosomal protein L37AE/L43A
MEENCKVIKMKRTKRVHVEGWLHVFFTEPIMERVARYLETRELFPFLLGVCKALRNRAIKSPQWNRIMEYDKRVFYVCHPLGTYDGPRYSEKQNILAKFINYVVHSRHTCSFCFRHRGGYIRPDSGGMVMCGGCGVARKLLVSVAELRDIYCGSSATLCLKLPECLPYRHELNKFVPEVYDQSDLLPCHDYRDPESFVVKLSDDKICLRVTKIKK